MSCGYVILAENTEKVNYIRCAEALAISIRRVMPNANVTLLTSKKYNSPLFDVIPLPYGDLVPDSNWKLSNDWQVYLASPYEHTIKLEADMFLPRSIDHWWDILAPYEIVLPTTIRDFRGQISDCRFYRKFIDDNNLPDVYNAITYFRKSDLAEEFFDIVRDVFENWSDYRAILKCKPTELVTTDWAYAMASHLLGKEKTTLPGFTEMCITHMKKQINELPSEDWTKSLIYECLPHSMRIHTFPQQYPLHYHIKSFSDLIIEKYS